MARPVLFRTELSSLEACGAGGRRAEAAAHADSQFCSFNFFAQRPRPKVAPVSSNQGHVYPRPVLPPLRRVASANSRWSLYCISDGGVVGKQTRQAERVASDKHTCLLWHGAPCHSDLALLVSRMEHGSYCLSESPLNTSKSRKGVFDSIITCEAAAPCPAVNRGLGPGHVSPGAAPHKPTVHQLLRGGGWP